MDTGFLIGVPTGQFGDNLHATGLGFSMSVSRSIGDSPFRVGGEFGYLLYGSQSWSAQLIGDAPDVVVTVHTTNNILLGHFFLRVQPRSGSFRPYAEGLIGGAYFITETSLEDSSSGESFASSKNLSDGALSYGVGGGVQWMIWDGSQRALGPVPIQLLLDGRVRYLRGSTARYLKEGSIRRENDEVFYDILESRTDMILPQISFVVRF